MVRIVAVVASVVVDDVVLLVDIVLFLLVFSLQSDYLLSYRCCCYCYCHCCCCCCYYFLFFVLLVFVCCCCVEHLLFLRVFMHLVVVVVDLPLLWCSSLSYCQIVCCLSFVFEDLGLAGC